MIRLRYSLLLIALFVCAPQLRAQVDTTRARTDTTAAQARPDTSTAAAAFADSVKPLPQLAQPFLGPASGFSDGVWVWDRTAFLLEATTSLGDLLERIPGINIFRSGLYAQPLAASFAGATANRVEVWLDGYILDPLLEGSFDVSKMELAEIESVRVERRLGRIRIFIKTLSAKETRAYSEIEAGVGQPNANLFRGLFVVPKLFFGPIGVAIDRIDTNGLRGNEPANQSAGWLKWAYVRKSGTGFQLQYRRVQTSRNVSSPWPDEYSRSDLIAQARAQITPQLVAEVFGGRTHLDLDSTQNRVDSLPHLNADETQLGGRVSFDTPIFWANAAAHLRDNKALPATQFDAAAGVHYSLFSGRAELTQSDWRDAGSANELTLQVQAGPWHGARLFGETTKSDRGAAYLMRLADSTATITSYKGYRAGGEVVWRGITAGAALLHSESDSVTPFGLPFDTINARYPGANVNGFELSGRVPLPLLKGFAVEGMVTNWRIAGTTGGFSIYLPTQQYRAGLEYYAIPLKSGNLEMLGRIELIHRGPMLAPARSAAGVEPATTSETMAPIDYVDAYVQIRIIDVRAFLRFEDLRGADPFQLPNRQMRGPRMFYGVKWQFFN